MATKKRRLEDLYVRGRELALDDESGDPVQVWLQKINPLDHEKAIRKAGAAKARVMLATRDPNSEEWQEAYVDTLELGSRNALVEYLISEAVVRFRDSKESELAFEEEWKKEGYLQGLHDAWAGEPALKDVYDENPEDEEARRVFLELKRFADQVEEATDAETENLRRDYEERSEEDLREEALKRFLELRAGLAWLREYRRNEIFFATRELDDHRKYYFATREQVDELAPEVFGKLIEGYQDLTVDPSEGKDLPRTLSSSPLSEQPSVAAT
jgi:hypothetical protein